MQSIDKDEDKASAITSEERDINDVFSDILLAENRVFEDTFNEGLELGKNEENIEAYHLGYHRGAEIGAEIGYYCGVVDGYITYYEKRETPDRKLMKELATLKEILDDFPKENNPDTDILAALSHVRAKFKKICAILKLHPEFPESDKLSF